MKELGETARLTFSRPNGKNVLEGKQVVNAQPGFDPHTKRHICQLKLNSEVVAFGKGHRSLNQFKILQSRWTITLFLT